jgi:hypothetical protein
MAQLPEHRISHERLSVERYRRFLGTLSVKPGLASMELALRAEGSDDRHLRELAFRYPLHSARHFWEFIDTAGIDRRSFLAATETAHRLSEAAFMTGYDDVRGRVYARGALSMVRLGSTTVPNIQAMDNRVPAILECFHEQIAAEGLPLRLELAERPTV